MIVRRLDPASTLLVERMEALIERYAALEYPHTPGRWPARYGLVTNDEAGLSEATGS